MITAEGKMILIGILIFVIGLFVAVNVDWHSIPVLLLGTAAGIVFGAVIAGRGR